MELDHGSDSVPKATTLFPGGGRPIFELWVCSESVENWVETQWFWRERGWRRSEESDGGWRDEGEDDEASWEDNGGRCQF